MIAESGSRLQRLEAYVQMDPDNLSLRGDLADELIQAGLAANALPHIEHALRLMPDDPVFGYRRAVALRRAGKLSDARSQLDTLLEQGVDDPAVFYERADFALQSSDFDGCVHWVNRVRQSPEYRRNWPNADLLLVRALHYLGRLDEAVEEAEAALAADSGRDDLRAALATLYLDAERLPDAARLYEQGGATPRAELQSVGGYLALADENPELARQRFEDALLTRPRDGRALLGAGLANAAGGRLPEAIGLMERAAAAMPEHLGTLNALAWMQLLSGNLDVAEKTLLRAQGIDDAFAETHGGLAVVAAMRGEREQAKELIRTALKLDRASFSAAYASMLLQHDGANPQTLSAALEFLSRQPAPGGGTMKSAVLRFAGASMRFRNPRD
jgi:tetratricopeptide (TPR) repeat protein